jgi:hypothetical protein
LNFLFIPADFRKKLFRVGAGAEGSAPQEASATFNPEIVRPGHVIKDASIRAD